MRYQLKKINETHYEVWKKGKLIKSYKGVNAYDEATDYIQDCVEDDRIYAHFYAE